jgi:hypothetical protein
VAISAFMYLFMHYKHQTNRGMSEKMAKKTAWESFSQEINYFLFFELLILLASRIFE